MKLLTFPCSIAWRDSYYDSEIDVDIEVTDNEYTALEEFYKSESYNPLDEVSNIDYNPKTIGVYARIICKLDSIIYETQSKDTIDDYYRVFLGLKDSELLPSYTKDDAKHLISIITRKVIERPNGF